VVSQAVQALRASALAEANPTQQQTGKPAVAGGGSALSLIDEDDVAVDIEIARCVEAARLQAEGELRELQAYTSALAGDINISRDTNPFRPERVVRALWAGVQTLPFPGSAKARVLHDAAEPMAALLRRTYQASCRRLEEQGVPQANHRTIVMGSGTHWGADLKRYRPPEDLHSLRDSMPTPLDALPPQQTVRKDSSEPTAPVRTAVSQVSTDPQLLEMLNRLFGALHKDIALPADIADLLVRLQPIALRVASLDPSLLDNYDHALWRFMNQLAHDVEHSAPSQRRRLLGLGRNLVDHLTSGQASDSQGFAWALDRLESAQLQLLQQSISAAAPDITRLQRIGQSGAVTSTAPMPLDISTLDTVPAELLAEAPAERPGPAVNALPEGVPPGARLRVYLQGDWRKLMCLWQDAGQDLVLLSEPGTGALWALRQRALSRLLVGGLAQPLQMRSLVRRAANKVLRAL
jgi:hypothetical protein